MSIAGKRILYVTTISRTINAFLQPHIKFLVDQGCVVDIATNVTDEIDDELLAVGVRIFSVRFQRTPVSLMNLIACRQMKLIQKRERYDIVHVHTPVASFVTRYALRNERNIKILYTCHGFYFYRGGPCISWILFYPAEKIAARWTDGLITMNAEDYAVARHFKLRNDGKVFRINGVGVDKKKYMLKSFDKNKYRRSLGLDDDDFVILVLAEINKRKNHIQLIRAMRLLKDKYPGIKSVFAGTGPLEASVRKKIRKYGLERQVILLGWRSDVKELIHCSDVTGLFSSREGLVQCVLEAMVCRKYVIATGVRGVRELFEAGANGIMLEVDDVEGTAKAIEQLYVNRQYEVINEENDQKSLDRFLIENVLMQSSCIYEELYQ